MIRRRGWRASPSALIIDEGERHARQPRRAWGALWIALLALVLAGIAVAVTSGAATTIVAGITYTGGT
jgi:hypothetical protein